MNVIGYAVVRRTPMGSVWVMHRGRMYDTRDEAQAAYERMSKFAGDIGQVAAIATITVEGES